MRCVKVERLRNALRRIAAIEPVEGKAAKNRGAMLQMQAIARTALDDAPVKPKHCRYLIQECIHGCTGDKCAYVSDGVPGGSDA